MRNSWSTAAIIDAILKLVADGKEINSNAIQKNHMVLYGAAKRYFGSWGKAVIAAGFNYEAIYKSSRRGWSKTIVVHQIQVRKSEGKSIRASKVIEEDGGLYNAGIKYFGSWAKARLAAGFTARDSHPRKKWGKDSIVKAILALHAKGCRLNVAAMLALPEGRALLGAAQSYFGGWGPAIRAAGLNYSELRKYRTIGWWTKKRILRKIRTLERGKMRLNVKTIRKEHPYLLHIAIKKFGSWSQAVEAAGIDYRKHSLLWSTKAMMRRMSDLEYSELLKK